MEYVRLGASGLRVSRIALGMMSYGDKRWRDWLLSEEEAGPLVRAAADAGVTLFDTADVYSKGASEEITGRLLRKIFGRREDYVLATKVRFPVADGVNDQGLSRGHIMDGVDASLRRLSVDHIDLYQIHRWDPDTAIEETMEALDDCVRLGKVRYLGASSMAAWQFAKTQHTADLGGWTRFVTMQNHYNLLYREEEREMIPLCTDMGVGLLPWSPLSRGILARSPTDGVATARSESDRAMSIHDEATAKPIVEVVGQIAEERGISQAQVAIAWLLSKPVVTAPIVGATKTSHIVEAVGSVEVHLTDEETSRLEASYTVRPVIDF